VLAHCALRAQSIEDEEMKRALGRAMPKGVRSRRRSTADMRGDAAKMMERVRLQYDAEGNRQVVELKESIKYAGNFELPKLAEERSVEELLGPSSPDAAPADTFDPRLI
jgi:hypothetical protein